MPEKGKVKWNVGNSWSRKKCRGDFQKDRIRPAKWLRGLKVLCKPENQLPKIIL